MIILSFFHLTYFFFVLYCSSMEEKKIAFWISKEIHKEFKAYAIWQGESIKSLGEKIIVQYLNLMKERFPSVRGQKTTPVNNGR